MDERLRFVARLLEGEEMARFAGRSGFRARPATESGAVTKIRAWRRSPIAPPSSALWQSIARAGGVDVIGCKRDKPHWGARKIRELLVRRLPHGVRVPANSTIHAVLDRHGLVKHKGRCGAEPRAHRCRTGRSQTISGAPITRVSSCWATRNTATP